MTIHSGRLAETLESGTTWDPDTASAQAERRRESGAAIGSLIGLVNPVAGTAFAALSSLSTAGVAQEATPTHPDSIVQVDWTEEGRRFHLSSDRLNNNVRPMWDYQFLVRPRSIRRRGIDLLVRDDDGADMEAPLIGEVAIPPAALLQVLENGQDTTLTLSNHELLEVVVRIRTVRRQETLGSARVNLALRQGVGAVGVRIPARSLVRVQAFGEGAVGGGYACPAGVGPRGLAVGVCRQYNLRAGTLATAPHGSAVVLLGRAPAVAGFSLADFDDSALPCAEFINPISGDLVVGVNDNDFTNNSGSFDFLVAYEVPSDEWSAAAPSGPWQCDDSDDGSYEDVGDDEL